MKRRKYGRVLSVILAVCMLLGTLPADLLGGIASVKAAESAQASRVVYTEGTWSGTTKTSTWDFTTNNTAGTSNEVTVGETLQGIEVTVAKVSMKGTQEQGLSLATGATVLVPLDASTTSVTAEITVQSVSSSRYLTVGDKTIYHKNADGAPSFEEGSYVQAVTVDSAAFSNGKLQIASPAGETKIQKIAITETKSGSSSGNNPVTQTTTFDASTLDATGKADKDKIAEGTTFEDGYFKVVGANMQYRVKNSAIYCVETASTAAMGSIQFTVKGTAKVEVSAASTGGSNTSEVVLLDETSAKVAEANSETTVTGTAQKTFTYNDVASGTYTVSTTDGARGARIYTITVTDTYTGSSAPVPVPVNVPVSIASGAALLGGGTVTITDANDSSNTFTVGSAGDTLSLMSLTTYNVSTPDNSKIKATVGGKTSFKTDATGSAVAIDVESLVVNPTVSLKSGSTLAAGKTLSVVDKNDASTALTVGSPVELWIGETYEIACDDTSVEARVNGATSFEVTADMTALEVELVSKANNVTMTVNGNLGTAKVVMTNVDDANDTVEFGNGETVELQLNATYEISCTNADLFAMIDGKQKYTVANAISALTVDITSAEFHTYDVYDFGGMQLASTRYNTYNNKWTVDTINGWFPGVEAGGTAKFGTETVLSTDSAKLKAIAEQDGKMWIRTKTADTGVALTNGKNDRTWQNVEDNSIKYQAAFWSDGNATTKRYLNMTVEVGDIVTIVGSRNNTDSRIAWRTPSEIEAETGVGNEAQIQTTATAGSSGNASELTYYATEAGEHKIYSINDKLVVCRIYRETPKKVTVSGTINAPADMTGATLVFTQTTDTGLKIQDVEVPVSGTSYSVQLQEMYNYTVSLKDKPGYIIDTFNTGDNGTFAIANSAGNQNVPISIIEVDLVTVTGSLADLTAEDAAKLALTFTSSEVYIPEFTVTAGTNNFTAVLERNVVYTLAEDNVGDYTLTTTTISASADGTQNIVFTKKPVYDIAVTLDGPSASEAANVALSFGYVQTDTALGEVDERYVYEFTGVSDVKLRDGQYKVTAMLDGYEQGPTADLKVNGAATTIVIPMESTTQASVTYKDTITVGPSGRDYTTINDALEAVRNMNRSDDQRVTIAIDPGNYEEMLVVDVDNVTLKNASSSPSLELTNKGVDIDANAVRITGYYGHGYAYYSMGDDYKWDADVLAANLANGYPSIINPGSGSTTFWNATVEVQGNGFEAEGIIFENSFNQYISKKAAEDKLIKADEWGFTAKEGAVSRIGMAEGDTTVQDYAYKERAAALAVGNAKSEIVFTNCKFIGRQDTLYGGKGSYVEFHDCSIYGSTDYIFGGMIAIFNECDLVWNTSDDTRDFGYITAAQQASGRGYLLMNCHVTSTVPGVDTASAYTSKPGYFGRPWSTTTAETVFVNTTIDATCDYWKANTDSKTMGESLIVPAGWQPWDGEGGKGTSENYYEYGTVEASGVDNSASRVDWANDLTSALRLNDGTYITFDAFRKQSAEGLYNIDLSKGLKEGVIYDGGISVMEDMGLKTDGFVQGTTNPAGDNKGGIPSDGAVLVLDAQQDGRLKLNIKSASGKTFYFVDGNGTCLESFSVEETMTKVFAVEAGQTYYVYAGGSKICLYSIIVDYRPSVDWSTVAAPVLGTPVVSQIGDATEGKVTIPYAAAIGGVYSDSMDLKVYKDGVLVDTINIVDETDPLKGFESEITIELPESGDYTFVADLKRLGEKAKTSNTVAANGFVLPMARPIIVNVESQGNGVAKFSWQAVAEAESYNVYLDGELVGTTANVYYRFTDLAAGTYEFKVEAVGNGDISVASYLKAEVTAEAKKNWLFAAFGDGVDTKNNKYEGSVEENNLVVHGAGGKGKLVPASTDGLAFYYTTIDPETENFTLTADVTVKEWKYSNGQEGFGLMAADAVGAHGDSTTFWNNSYMLSATKVEYKWDPVLQAVADEGTKYSMKLGIGAQEKIGVTPENIEDMKSGIALDQFVSRMATLETDAPEAGYIEAGTFNRVGNYTNEGGTGGIDLNMQTTFKMTLQRNNTGYILSYTDENGVTTSKTYYHDPDNGDALAKLDPNNIYVGFFASRNAVIAVENVSLTTINPADDAPAEERPIEYVPVTATFESASYSTTAGYELVYYGNADGTLTIYSSNSEELIAENLEVKADTKYRFSVTLSEKGTEFEGIFVPDPNFAPSKYERLDNYGKTYFSKHVDFTPSDRNIYYVSPEGGDWGIGTKESPMDLYTAVASVDAGDYILLMEGTYNYSRTVTIERGINGTEDNMIYLIADPEATSRPVIDFNRGSAGIVLAGDYWYFQGFDVTNTQLGQKGIQVSGDNNILDRLYTYRNGNTGIQISRFKGTDTWEDWPSNNLVLNCTSYLNADAGYEDADGFAAKLTVADGNVFDGCIAAYNADDGWDLFAKIETGPIGVVTIKNSIAFKNGFDIAADGSEIIAGNGNGFKMGGGSIEGAHVLENSIAFANRAKGIDSNSGPNIKVYNSTSFDNASYNVAFYTNTAKNTDYYAEGIISYNKNNTEADSIKLRGTQDDSQVYGEYNYYEKGTKSTNTKKVQVRDDWFVSLDTDAAIHGGITRNADGTINMNGYLELTDAAPLHAGATLDATTGTASEVIVIDEDKIAEDEADDEDDDASDESTEEGSDSSDSSASESTGSGSTGSAGAGSSAGKTEGGKTEGGKTEGGKTEDGKTEGGKTEGGKTEGGKTEGGKTEDGKTEDGKTDGDKKEDGKTEGGKTEDGKTESSSESSNAGASAPAGSEDVEGGNSALPIILGLLGVVAVAGIIFLIVLKRKDKEDEE